MLDHRFGHQGGTMGVGAAAVRVENKVCGTGDKGNRGSTIGQHILPLCTGTHNRRGLMVVDSARHLDMQVSREWWERMENGPRILEWMSNPISLTSPSTWGKQVAYKAHDSLACPQN